jgi:hypothetical protein
MKLKSILLGMSAVLGAAGAYAQSEVATGGQKYVLLEEGTGTWCGYCPDGSQRIQETIEPTYPRCIAVAFHNGDGMALTGDPFNATYITGFPGGTVDRVPYPSSATSCQMGRGSWAAATGVQYGVTPTFDVRMISTYDTATRLVTVKVTGKALVASTGSFRINAYVIEDSISSATYPQGSYMNTTTGSWYMGKGSPITPASWYAHMGVVTKVLATGGSIWGDAAFTNPAAGDSVTKTYTYTIPAGVPYKQVKIVGLVQKYGTTNTDRAIQNSIRAKVSLMQKVYPAPTDVKATLVMSDVELFPNPAANVVRVEGYLPSSTATTISIVNALGQTVSVNKFPAGGTMFSEVISVADLANGTYFMNIATEGGNVSKQFVIAK